MEGKKLLLIIIIIIIFLKKEKREKEKNIKEERKEEETCLELFELSGISQGSGHLMSFQTEFLPMGGQGWLPLIFM